MSWMNVRDQLKSKMTEIFSIDTRSMAAFRISLGLLWLLELIVRITQASAYYTDQGILPREKALLHFPETAAYSLSMFSGEVSWQWLILGVSVISTLFMIFGRATRFATFITWILCISIQSRNEMVLYGADHLIRVLLFWSIFLPTAKSSRRVSSVWTAAVLIQVSYFYLFSALLKTGAEWRESGTALYYAFHYDQLTGELGRFLLQFPKLLQGASIGVFYFELLIAILLFFPFSNFKNRMRLRLFAVILLAGFHAGIAATMTLFLIPFANLAALWLFVPSAFWDLLGSRFSFRFHEEMNAQARKQWLPAWISQAAGTLLIVYVFFWNVGTVSLSVDQKFPHRLGYLLRLDQNWGFYAPRPFVVDGWWRFPGKTKEGVSVNAWSLEKTEVELSKPSKVSDLFLTDSWWSRFNTHWMAHSILSLDSQNAPHREYMLDYLCRRWNHKWSGNSALEEISYVYVEEVTKAKDEEIKAIPYVLSTKKCSVESSTRR